MGWVLAEFLCQIIRIIEQVVYNLTGLLTSGSLFIYKGGLKSSRPSLPETQDKRPLGRELDRSWCHCHTSMIKLFWSQPMAP